MNEGRLLEYLQTVTLEILATVAKTDMSDPTKRYRTLRQIDNILDQFGMTVQEVLPQALILKYFEGVQEANRELGQAGLTLRHKQVLTAEGKISQPFQKAIHLNAVERIINDTMLDLSSAIATARVSAGVAIEKALNGVNEDISLGLLLGDTRKTISLRVMDTFLKEGMTSFVTKDGKQLTLDFYASTVARTKTREATVRGHLNRYTDTGQDLIMITGNGDGCALCSQYQGMVFSLEGKTAGFPIASEADLPPFHPNCNCGQSPYVIQFKTDEEIQSAMERNSEFSPGEDRRTPAQKKAYEKEQKLRRIANAEKKQFIKYQEALGADAPKTLGAFRRMKHQNTPKFQELQSNYRSYAMTKDR